MTDAQIQQLIDQKIAAAQKKSLYSTKNASYHTHNGIDSPKISSGGGLQSTGGRSHNPKLAAIPANTGGTPQNLQLQTNDFATGVTWDAANYRFSIIEAGIYVATATINFSNDGNVAGVSFGVLIKQNGTETARASATNESDYLNVSVSDILNCAAGDYVEFFAFTTVNAHITIDGASGGIGLV